MALDYADRTEFVNATRGLAATLTTPPLLTVLGGAGHDGIDLECEPGAPTTILSFLDAPDPASTIVTP